MKSIHGTRGLWSAQIVAGLKSGDDVELVKDAVGVPVALFECRCLAG